VAAAADGSVDDRRAGLGIEERKRLLEHYRSVLKVPSHL
jgi:hypothetical protein